MTKYVYTILRGSRRWAFTDVAELAAWLVSDEGYFATCVLRSEEGESFDPSTATMLTRRDIFKMEQEA